MNEAWNPRDGDAFLTKDDFIFCTFGYEHPASQMERCDHPSAVVAMIGMYRNTARKGDFIKVSGVLERVENLHTDRIGFQVAVGSGTNEDEYIFPVTTAK